MPLKPRKPQPKSSSDKNRSNISSTEKKFITKMQKKVLISKKWHSNCSHEVKTKSVGVIDSKKPRQKCKKVSNSLPAVPKHSENLDFCKTCGDTDDIETAVGAFANTVTTTSSKTSAILSRNSKLGISSKKKESETDSEEVKVETKVVKEYYRNEKFAVSKSAIDYTKKSSKSVTINSKKDKEASKTSKKEVEIEDQVVQEHYLNERFADLYDSMHDFDNIIRSGPILDTITEVPEKQGSSNGKSGLSNKKSSRDSNVCLFDPVDDDMSLKSLKEFREKNYFECHSTKNRVESKGSVISLQDHKCRYRLYLNDRLFPVAIDNDHNDNIRCVDCHLPLELSSEEDKVNGTIQAKVKLGSETQDMVLLLPIKEPLIVKQKRKEKNDDDTVYFGLVKMDQNGNSMFNRSLPTDSLALRYQKGYRQLDDEQRYRYDKIQESDVIYI